jgi:uncharacterized membrane protein
MKYIVAASLFAVAVSAQGFSDIPPCALGCAATNLKLVTKCKPGLDNIQNPEIQACLCDSPDFQEAFAKCAQEPGTCDDASKCKLFTVSQQICGSKLTVPEPAGCAKGTTTAAAPPKETTTEAAPPSEETTTEAAPPAETTEPAGTTAAPEETSAAAAPPAYGGETTIATESSAAVEAPTGTGAPATSATFVAGASNVVFNGGVALFAGFVAILAL